jgi:hypothetical protein
MAVWSGINLVTKKEVFLFMRKNDYANDAGEAANTELYEKKRVMVF